MGLLHVLTTPAPPLFGSAENISILSSKINPYFLNLSSPVEDGEFLAVSPLAQRVTVRPGPDEAECRLLLAGGAGPVQGRHSGPVDPVL